MKNLSISTKSGAEDGVLGGDDASDTMATVYGGACPGSSYGNFPMMPPANDGKGCS